METVSTCTICGWNFSAQRWTIPCSTEWIAWLTAFEGAKIRPECRSGVPASTGPVKLYPRSSRTLPPLQPSNHQQRSYRPTRWVRRSARQCFIIQRSGVLLFKSFSSLPPFRVRPRSYHWRNCSVSPAERSTVCAEGERSTGPESQTVGAATTRNPVGPGAHQRVWRWWQNLRNYEATRREQAANGDVGVDGYGNCFRPATKRHHTHVPHPARGIVGPSTMKKNRESLIVRILFCTIFFLASILLLLSHTLTQKQASQAIKVQIV